MRESRLYGSVRGARGNSRPLYVADCLANKQSLPSSEENGEPLSSLWRMSLCGRLGPVFLSSAVQTGRYPGTRMSRGPAAAAWISTNIELGLLVRDRALALSVSSHFRKLIGRGLLRPLPAS